MFSIFTDDEDLSTISDDFESMSIQSSTEDSQNDQSCSSRYISNTKYSVVHNSINRIINNTVVYNQNKVLVQVPKTQLKFKQKH